MRLSKKAKDEFLERSRDNSRWWKYRKFRELQSYKKDLPVKPPIWKKLRHHQKACFIIGTFHPRYAFHLDMGCGKTVLSIALTRYYKRLKKVRSVLVLVPNKINCSEWALEIEKHSSGSRYKILEGSTEQKWNILTEEPTTFIITTYAGFIRMVSKETPRYSKDGKLLGQKLEPNDKLIGQVLQTIDGLILDESTTVGNHQSLTFRILKKMRKKVNILYELTGTPFGRDPTPLWAQMFLVDDGESLGATLGMFRATFYSEQLNKFTGFPEYVFKESKHNMKTLHKFLSHRAIRYEAEAADLPDTVHIRKEVRLPADAEAQYEDAKEKLKKSLGNTIEMRNSFLRMRQISSGFVGFKGEEDGKRHEFKFDENPKLDLLISLIHELKHDHKFVIFHQFTLSGDMICERLKEEGVKHVRIYGKSKNQDQILKEFNQNDSCRGMVLNNACGGFGLNLQIAKYGIYYESPVDPITRKQTRRRIERQGSKHGKVFIYDLVSKGTVDGRILKMLASGQDLFQGVIEGRNLDNLLG